jgi:hypothetical protein
MVDLSQVEGALRQDRADDGWQAPTQAWFDREGQNAYLSGKQQQPD